MRLIAITLPDIRENESREIERMLRSGRWWRIHIRKPDATDKDVARLITAISPELRQSLSIHNYLHLAAPLGLGGVHLNARCPEAPAGWGGLTSRSCHTLAELELPADYRFLSPIFNSISKPGYLSAFSPEELRGRVDDRTFALGGVTESKLTIIQQLGFGGAAMLGAAWK